MWKYVDISILSGILTRKRTFRFKLVHQPNGINQIQLNHTQDFVLSVGFISRNLAVLNIQRRAVRIFLLLLKPLEMLIFYFRS